MAPGSPASPRRPGSGRLRSARLALVACAVAAWAPRRASPPACGLALPPPGPGGGYSFRAKRAILHLCIVPEPAPAKTGIPGPKLPDGVNPLGLFGRTVGGSFYVDWDESPLGPYREAGLLSSLVFAPGAPSVLDAWGGWASHIWVDKPDAAELGRRLWGLPTATTDIDAEEARPDGTVLAFGRAPLVHVGEGVGPLGRIDLGAKITVGNQPWDAASGEEEADALPWPLPQELTVPNLSGLLPEADPGDVAAGADCRQLLAYPIRLRPGGVRFLDARQPTGGSGIVPRTDFSSWWPLFSVELRDVAVEVGAPKAL